MTKKNQLQVPRMRLTTYLILRALSLGPQSVQGTARLVIGLTYGRVELTETNVLKQLKRLMSEDLARQYKPLRTFFFRGRERNLYELTEKGTRELLSQAPFQKVKAMKAAAREEQSVHGPLEERLFVLSEVLKERPKHVFTGIEMTLDPPLAEFVVDIDGLKFLFDFGPEATAASEVMDESGHFVEIERQTYRHGYAPFDKKGANPLSEEGKEHGPPTPDAAAEQTDESPFATAPSIGMHLPDLPENMELAKGEEETNAETTNG